MKLRITIFTTFVLILCAAFFPSGYAAAQNSLDDFTALESGYIDTSAAKTGEAVHELRVEVEEGQSKIYGEIDPELSYTITGFQSGDDESILTGSLSREQGEDAGSYSITRGNLSAGDSYSISFVGERFEILPKELLITADDQAKVYGEDDPELSYSATGFEQGDDEEVFSGRLTREPGEDTGSYIILPGTLDAGNNYSIQFLEAEFEITSRPLTLTNFTADDKIYDGTTSAAGTRFDDDRVAGDDLDFDYIVSFEDSEAANDKDVTFTGILITGGSAMDNYRLVTKDGSTTANIAPRPIAIRAKPVVKIYGDDNPAIDFEFTEGELAKRDSFSGELSRKEGTDVGRYAITQGTLTAGSNYELTFSPEIFEIIPRQLRVMAKHGQVKTYGADDPEFEYSAEGFAPGDGEEILTGELTRQKGEDAGKYRISEGTLTANHNYDIHFEESEFEIIPNELSVKADQGQSKVYGEDDPLFTFSADGFVFDDGEDLFKGELSRQKGEDAGRYKITIGNLDAGKNYSLKFSGEEFQIEPRVLQVSAESGQRKVYGEKDPELKFSATNFGRNDDEKIFKGSLSRTEGESVGFYKINQGSLSAGKNYKIDFKEESFGIEYRTLKIAAESGHSKRYGANDPVFKYSVEGFAPGDDKSLLRGELSRMEGEDAGEYAITAGDLSVPGDYRIEFTGALFEILPKALTVKPESGQNKFVGEEDPELMFQARGFEFDDDYELIRGALSREPGEETGEYSIFQGSLSAGLNYTINFTGNSFRILMTPPVATRFTPSSGEMRASINTPVRIDLDQPLNSADLDLITIKNSDLQPVSVESEVNGKSIWIEHDGLEYETNYTIHIPSGALKNVDDVVNDDIGWTFRTRDLIPPNEVALSAPSHEQGTVSRRPELTWTSSELASHYRVQISENRNFNSTLMDIDNVTDPAVLASVDLDYYAKYYWRVQALNSAGASKWSDARAFKTVAKTPELLFPAMSAEGVSIAPRFEWTSACEDGFSRFQLSASESFTGKEVDTLVAEPFLDLTGLDDDKRYYWRVRTEREFGNSEWTAAEDFHTRRDPAGSSEQLVFETTVDFGGRDSGEGDISGLDYRLIGLPGSAQHRVDDLLSGTYGSEWKAFLNTGNGTDLYEEYHPDDERFVFKPGQGFWVLSRNSLNMRLNINSVETNERDAYTIELQPGWNIISNPHRNSVSWADVLELNEIRSDLFGYQGRFVPADSLRPAEGYYFYNDVDNPLQGLEIPYSSMRQRRAAVEAGSNDIVNPAKLSAEQRAKISAGFGGNTEFDIEVVYSVSDENRGKFNRHFPSLEMSRNGLMLKNGASNDESGFLRIESVYDERGTKYRAELKGDAGSSFRWKADLEGLDSFARVLIMHPGTGQSWLLSDEDEVEVVLTESPAAYDIYIGNDHFLVEKQEEMIPKGISLQQNYPNPFNPSTTIRYSIPNQQHVRLEVYNVIGRRVQIIQDGVQSAGWHSVRFNGSNLSSGVYFYRLHSEGAIKTGRMTLIK